MDESAVKESRVILRLIQDHLLAADALAGTTHESAGMVDVVYHPHDLQPELNYVLPRRNTAWVPTATIDAGLSRLRELARGPRFQYMEGLFPALFGETLTKIGLEPESARPVLAFRPGGIGGSAMTRPAGPAQDVRVRRVSPDRAASLWQQAGAGWRFLLDRRRSQTESATQWLSDRVAYRQRVPVGILRIEVQPETGTAHLVALALRDGESEQLARDLLGAGVRLALRHGGGLVFALPDKPAAELLTALQFVEVGQLKRYVAAQPAPEMERTNGRLAQPVPTGR